MPMPPMPTKCMGPSSRGQLHAGRPPLRASRRCDRSTSSARRSAASGMPALFAACGGAASGGRGSASRLAQLAGQPLGREVACGSRCRRPSPRASRRWPPGRCRAHAAAAPGWTGRPITASSATVEAPERATTRCAAAMRAGRSRKKGATSALDADVAHRLAHALEILLARLLDDCEPRARPRGSSARSPRARART